MSGGKFQDLYFDPLANGVFTFFQNQCCDISGKIVLSAILTDIGWDLLDDNGNFTSLQSNRDFPCMCLALFAQNAFHGNLLRKSAFQSPGSGR
jgi:hypothetical protein